MDLENHAVMPIVERALAMSAVDREGWCLEWAQWLWAWHGCVPPSSKAGRSCGRPRQNESFWV